MAGMVNVSVTLAQVVERLGLGGGGVRWAEGLDALGPPPFDVALPGGDAVGELLAQLNVDPADAADVLASLPSPDGWPEWWWLLERSVHQLTSSMGDPSQSHGGWPDWIGSEQAVPLARRCFMAHVFLATVPHTRVWHLARGIPDDTSWASLQDLGRHMAIHRRTYGATGVDAAWWLSHCLRGESFDLGRLQFTYFELAHGDDTPWWYPWDEAETLGEGFRQGDACIGVHIPESGPMTPEACDESFGQAAAFFPRYFPVPSQSRRLATCWSWLLDDELGNWLPEESNIMRFQRRFELVPGGMPTNDALKFVFRTPIPSEGVNEQFLASLPVRTTLERAIIAHLRASGQWRSCSGWVDLSAT
jgi:hypothetical protein